MQMLLAVMVVASIGSEYAKVEEKKEIPIGSKVAKLSFTDTRFLVRSLDDFPKRKAFVLVFVDTGCPLVKRYLPILTKMEAEYRKSDVQFIAVGVGNDDIVQDLAALAVEFDVPFPFVRDSHLKCVDALGVESTPEVVVLDAERRIRYRGRIDDQYRPGGSRPAATRNDLKEAIDDVLAAKDVRIASTTVDGCRITRVMTAEEKQPPTFAEHVAPLIHQHCAVCHRSGASAPFSLVTYEEVRSRAKTIVEATADGKMPPWYAAATHGRFSNERKLTPAQRDIIRRWAKNGSPQGDEKLLAKLPKIEELKAEWLIGKPDLVLSTETYEIPATGDIDYKYAILPHIFIHETWLQSVQIMTDNPKVVHHANLAYFSVGKKPDASNFITGLVPGSGPMQLTDGVACRLPAASMLALQIHMVSTGKPEKCQLRVGVKYPTEPVNKQLRFFLFDGRRFTIPAEAPAHPIKATFTLDCDAIGIGMFAHMHLRGKAMTFRAQPPDGEAETLLMIPNYHFDWQIPYVWEPGSKKLPKGTKLECVGLYDNSAFNPFNPAPETVVRSGPQTYHEMMNGFLFYVDANEKLNLKIDPKNGRAMAK